MQITLEGRAGALAQDNSSPVVQVWSLYELSLIADSSGPIYRGYIEPTLSVVLTLLLNVSFSYIDIYQCIGKLLSAQQLVLNYKVHTSSISMARSSFLCACGIMQHHENPLVHKLKQLPQH
ncbi:hypothetical protein HCN44_006016 [Aphidius gifuensis]|uniref:Uncharacterized protein n=1 Tax=Aphidius gifuensis TaxID=684658 RepID=A0A835CYA8_APHGI|nr:hypothetical protein HCN44_006016 [Aphidius gifuensis]